MVDPLPSKEQAFEAWLSTLPPPVQTNIREALLESCMESYTYQAFMAAWDARPAHETPAFHQGAAEVAFTAGWRTAASWAERDDLMADIGSPRYVSDMERALMAVRLFGSPEKANEAVRSPARRKPEPADYSPDPDGSRYQAAMTRWLAEKTGGSRDVVSESPLNIPGVRGGNPLADLDDRAAVGDQTPEHLLKQGYRSGSEADTWWTCVCGVENRIIKSCGHCQRPRPASPRGEQ